MNNYIYEYYQQIKDGRVVVGKWILMLYENIIKGLENKSFFYDAKKTKSAIVYIENFCHHHEGELAPQKVVLELWEKALISLIFGIVDRDGRRVHREVFVLIGRKNGKTLIASAIASYVMYCGSAWGDYGTRIYFTAPKLEQASLCYDAFYQSILQEPALASISKKRRSDIYVQSTNSSAKPLSYSAKKSDGLNISLAVCDEVGSWQGENGLRFYNVLKSSQGARREPLILSISTAGYSNTDGIFEDLFSRSTRVLMGNSKEKRLLPVLYMIDDPEKWDDINELRKANPNLGVSITVDYLLEEIAVASGSIPKKAEFLVKYANITQNASTAWLSSQTIEKAVQSPVTLEQYKGREMYCVGGIDLSRSVDLTSANIVVEENGKLNVISHFWLPAERLDEAIMRDEMPYRQYIEQGVLSLSGDNYINYKDVYEWFVSLVRDYKLYPLKIGYDRYTAQYLVDDLKAFGFHCDDVYQGYNLTSVITQFEGQIKDGEINIGENSLLKAHLYNSALKADTESVRVKLVKLSAKDHIDGVASLLDSLTVRQKHFSEIGKQLKNEGK